MSKRFTDTQKWRKTWIRKLPPRYKLFWLFILDMCDHAGILDYDLELFSFMLGVDFDTKEIKEIFGAKLIFFKKDTKIFIPKFIDFQYGNLNEDNKVHLSVINLLKKQDLFKGLNSSLYKAKDKDKEKEVIISFVPAYVLSTPDKQFRRMPTTFINKRTWENEITNNANESPYLQLYKKYNIPSVDHQRYDDYIKQNYSGKDWTIQAISDMMPSIKDTLGVTI